MEPRDGLPRAWSDWKWKERIGEGTFGIVYRAERETDGKTEECAIKVIRVSPRSLGDYFSLKAGEDSDAGRSFLKNLAEEYLDEIRVAELLGDCPNIVKIQDYMQTEEADGSQTIYIRMEYLHSFTEYSRMHLLSETDLLRMGIDICNALCACEKKQVIHRDVKPGNLFVDDRGRYKLGDFGLARTMSGSLTHGTIRGTYSYMAPEIYHGEKYGKTVDIYSLGMVLYKWMNNRRDPFIDLERQMIYHKDLETALQRRMSGEEELSAPRNASAAFSDIILRACAFDPSVRYTSAEQMKEAMKALLQQEEARDSKEVTEDGAQDSKMVTEDGVRDSKDVTEDGAQAYSGDTAGVEVRNSAGNDVKEGTQNGIAGGSFSGPDQENAGKNDRDQAHCGDTRNLPRSSGTGGQNDRETGSVPFRRPPVLAAVVFVCICLTAAAGLLWKNGKTGAVKNTAITEQAGLSDAQKKLAAAGAPSDAADAMIEYLLLCVQADDYAAFSSCFINAEEDTIRDYYSDLQEFLTCPYRCVIPVEQSEQISMFSVVGYDNPEQLQTSSFMLLLSRSKDSWVINLDPVESARVQGMAQADLFPSGYREAMESGDRNYQMADFFNYMYLDPEAVYAGCFTSQVKFFWQDEQDNLYLTLFLTNDTGEDVLVTDISVRLTDPEYGILADVALADEIAVAAGTNDLSTFMVSAEDLDPAVVNRKWSAQVDSDVVCSVSPVTEQESSAKWTKTWSEGWEQY